MIALYEKAIKRLFLPYNFWGRLEIDCFENNQSIIKKHNTFVGLEREGYFSKGIMIVDRKITQITEKYMENLKKRRMICVKTFGKCVKTFTPLSFLEKI